MNIQDIIDSLQDPKKKKLFKNAFDFADKAHKGQKRKSGEPYITHPIAVAERLWKRYGDLELTIAGLIHDTIEDCESLTIDMIYKKFGPRIGFLVDATTKTHFDFHDKSFPVFTDKTERLLWAGLRDIRVLILKLTDRGHNLDTIKHLPEDRQVRMSFETQAIYEPLSRIFHLQESLDIPQIKKYFEKYLKENKIINALDLKKNLVSTTYQKTDPKLFNRIYGMSDKVLWEIDDLEYFEELCRDPQISPSFEIVSIHHEDDRRWAIFRFLSASQINGRNLRLSPSTCAS